MGCMGATRYFIHSKAIFWSRSPSFRPYILCGAEIALSWEFYEKYSTYFMEIWQRLTKNRTLVHSFVVAPFHGQLRQPPCGEQNERNNDNGRQQIKGYAPTYLGNLLTVRYGVVELVALCLLIT